MEPLIFSRKRRRQRGLSPGAEWRANNPYPRPGNHETPATPYSVSRASPGSVLSNAQVIDVFASTMKLTEQQKKSFTGNILFVDSIDQRGNGGSWTVGEDKVRGGRLGRDHTLEDVPNHYVRDSLMNYIDDTEKSTERQKEAGRNAIVPDLTPEEVKNYCALLNKMKEDEEEEWRVSMGFPGRNATSEEIRKHQVRTCMFVHDVRTEKQAEAILRQQDVVRAIDESVDLKPLEIPVAIRQYERWKPLAYSVLKPNELRSSREAMLEPPTQIDRNCDQIRLMIRRFCYRQDPGWFYDPSGKEFSIDHFQKALGIQRSQMTTFLGKRGPKEGAGTKVYHLAWEFFKKREMLGYPLEKGKNKPRPKGHDPNRKGKKRRLDDADISVGEGE